MKLLESIEKSTLVKIEMTDLSHGRITFIYLSGNNIQYAIQASLIISILPASIFNNLRTEFQHHGLTHSYYSNKIIKKILDRIINNINNYKDSELGKNLIHEIILDKLKDRFIDAFKAGISLEEIKSYIERIYNLEIIKEVMHS